LNVAETELSVLSQQCLDQRIPSAEKLTTELAAWRERRNTSMSRVVWRFNTEQARVKLKHLYPIFETDNTASFNALL
jgi:hypothetical protein